MPLPVPAPSAARTNRLQRRRASRALAPVLTAGLILMATACDRQAGAGPVGAGVHDIHRRTGATTVRLGYFATIAHAPALIGVERGLFAAALGDSRLEVATFRAGPEAVEALFADALDVAYVGPNPAINAWVRSHGRAIRVVAGSTSGGVSLVTRPEITTADQLRGRTIATPQLGGTQDVAARSWLREHGLSTDTSGGGDVSIEPQPNGEALAAFRAGRIDGAWVPEPWATRLVVEGGGRVLADESTRWPGGRFATATIVVRSAFLDEHPDVVAAVLRAHLDAIDLIDADPAAARDSTNAALARLIGKPLPDDVMRAAWAHLTFSADPLLATFGRVAADAVALDLLDRADVEGIEELSVLDQVLRDTGRPPR